MLLYIPDINRIVKLADILSVEVVQVLAPDTSIPLPGRYSLHITYIDGNVNIIPLPSDTGNQQTICGKLVLFIADRLKALILKDVINNPDAPVSLLGDKQSIRIPKSAKDDN